MDDTKLDLIVLTTLNRFHRRARFSALDKADSGSGQVH